MSLRQTARSQGAEAQPQGGEADEEDVANSSVNDLTMSGVLLGSPRSWERRLQTTDSSHSDKKGTIDSISAPR